jgi:hypothetical protein
MFGFLCYAAEIRAAHQAVSVTAEQLHRDADDALRLETEFALQFLERCRGAEGLHADDAAGGADIAVPAQHRSLLDGEACLHIGRQHIVPIGLRLLLENVPGRHRDNARAYPLNRQRFMSLND